MQNSIVCSICEKDELVITDPESGEIICSRCGQVFLDRIQEDRQEWRAFNLEGTNRRSRTGMPASVARHDMGLATVIGKIDKDASGRSLEPSMCSTMRRLRIWGL
jgi:transcription initiation factor TFIIB